MGYWISLFVLLFVIAPIIFALGRNIFKTFRSIRGEDGALEDKVPLGMEATDLNYVERVNATNEWLSRANGSDLNRTTSGGTLNISKPTAPLRLGKTGDEYSKNYHKLFGRKPK